MNRTKVLDHAEDFLKENHASIVTKLENIQSGIGYYLDDLDLPEEDQYLDVRLNLQVDEDHNPERLRIKSGDPSLDQDHRGYWSAGMIGKDTNIQDVVFDLKRDLLDHLAQSI